MAKYLLEIGVEELPYGLIDSISAQIKDNFEKTFEENNISYETIKTYTTPRRLVFIIEGLSEVQADIEKIFKGPNTKIAIDDNGNYSLAAIGFAKKYGADVSQLYKLEENNQEYVALKIQEKGKSLMEVLPDIVPNCVLKVQGPHFMRWSAFDEKFSRPLRWIVSILDNKEVPVEITNIKSSNKSRAHRFCVEKNPVIDNVDNYFDIMMKHNVIVDEEQRKQIIVQKVQELASSIGAEAKIEDELLKEVTNIVEWPKPVLGNFDEKYLQIPEPVIVTVMASHQRYFPIYKDGKLVNGFITVANFVGDDISNIKNGNERVIKARLEDAIFFYNEDIKTPMIERVDMLEGITFQKGIGSLKDKTARIIKIADAIAQELGYNAETTTYKNILRTALFAKADLTTSLVFEFTELQGVIGSYYAKYFKENDDIALGIQEHYYPLVADAELASKPEGQIVGIADKLDTICAVFALNKIPSGSADPLGVRRAAIGILQTLMQKKLQLNLYKLIDFVVKNLNLDIKDIDNLEKNIAVFFIQRLRGIFSGKYQSDVVDAVLCTRNTLQSLSEIIEKLNILQEVVNTDDLTKVVAAHNRVCKIVRNQKDPNADNFTNIPMKNAPTSQDILGSKVTIATQANARMQKDIMTVSQDETIQEALFQCDAEFNLYRYMRELASKTVLAHRAFYDMLVKSVPLIDKFFEDVMVMDEDISIRNNRLRLLSLVNKQFMRLADFTRIIK